MRKILLTALCVLAVAACLPHVGGTLSMTNTKLSADLPGVSHSVCAQSDGKMRLSTEQLSLLPSFTQSAQKESQIVQWAGKKFSVPLWDETSGARDQFVFVQNQRTDAPCYFRTFIAFENSGDAFDQWIVVNWNDSGDYQRDDLGEMVITTATEEIPCRVFALTYKKPLAEGEVAPPSVMQIAMKAEATNKDVEPLGMYYSTISATEAIWADMSGDDAADAAEKAAINGTGALDTYLGKATTERVQSMLSKAAADNDGEKDD